MILSADLIALQHGKDPQNLDSPSSKQPLAQYLIMFPAVNLKGKSINRHKFHDLLEIITFSSKVVSKFSVLSLTNYCTSTYKLTAYTGLNSLWSLYMSWQRFKKVLETFSGDFGSGWHDSVTQLLKICQLHVSKMFHMIETG